MGILDATKRQFVSRPDEAKDKIMYKWEDRTIPMFTQLTVQQDEVAIFFKEGKVAGSVEAGRHTLDGKNIPFLGGLIDAVTGGDFLLSELYFISTREFANVGFGGKVDALEEPTTKLVIDLRVFGEYSVKVTDPEKMILKLIGTQDLDENADVTDWVNSLLMNEIRQIIAGKVMDGEWPMVGIARHNDELADLLLPKTNEEVSQYGIEVVKFGNINVNMRDEDSEELKRMRRDLAYASSDGAADAAMKVGIGRGMEKGGGANGAGAGVGIGAGIAIGSDIIKDKK